MYNHAYVNLHKHVFFILYWFNYKNMYRYLNIIKFQNGDSQFLEAFAYLYYQDMITSAECLFHTIAACQEFFFFGGGWISCQWVILKGIIKIYKNIEIFLGSNFAKISQQWNNLIHSFIWIMSITYMTHEKKVKIYNVQWYVHLDWGLIFYKCMSHPIDINYSDNWFFILQPNI